MSKKSSVLENFGRNLTEEAREGKLDPVIGRGIEIQRVAQVLSRRKKNNPVLIGEPGVGKTAIVEGLASKILDREVSRVLHDMEIIDLDLASMVAGTKYRGQFEERIKAVMKELENRDDVIIFIDEIHTLVGAGSSRGGLDASNMMKPALARGDIQCIGATTLDEYRTGIEDDGALDRRFQKIVVDPPSESETIEILNEIKRYYEDHHHVRYDNEAIVKAVKMSGRYITDRFFPDKAIDVIDEAGSRVHLNNVKVPSFIEEIELKIAEKEAEKAETVEDQEFEKAATIRDEIEKLNESLEEKKIEWEKEAGSIYHQVNSSTIAEVVSMMTGIPVDNISETEREKIINLEENLQDRVVGQEKAIVKLSKAIRRSRSGIKDPDKPIGTFLFLGPTGVGKTELAKVLSDEFVGSKDNLIRIDMSEYMEKFSASQLMGAPPGYVGYEQGGQLTEKVRRNPHSVILLDEIEKAHHSIFNTLLQIFDDGIMTDGLGRTVDFKNTIIIMTSNIGSDKIVGSTGGFGFSVTDNPFDYESMKSKIESELGNTFNPEFINRLDDVIVFNALSKENIFEIIDLEMEKLYERLNVKDINLEMEESAKQFLLDKGFDPEYGARPLKRAIQTYIEDELSEMILRDEIGSGSEISVREEDTGKLEFIVDE